MDSIDEYQKHLPDDQQRIMSTLRRELDAVLGQQNSRIWHKAPVWFVGENPVAGYSVNSRGVCLLFWNGQAFGEASLHPIGKFHAAELRFVPRAELPVSLIRRLARRAKSEVWDSVGHFKAARAAAKKSSSPKAR
jgi:hypothetical protein